MTEQLQISELFYSIQGESTRAGLPCLFIRLAGCNLRCSYCDAAYTWEEDGSLMPLSAILSWVDEYPDVLVEITGGEPLLQEPVYTLMDQLLTRGRHVLLETNGSLSVARVPGAVGIIMDLKCPGSGMGIEVEWKNISTLRARKENGSNDELKFVLTSDDDFLWARDIVLKEQLTSMIPVLFSPVQPLLNPAHLAELLLEHRLPVRLQLQLHTILWPDQTRGV